MKVRFYHFSKRNKSTKQPAGTDSYQEKEVALKDKCSITAPLLLCQTENVAAYNYAYIPSWNRYYFISEAASVENMWEVALVEDYLASYKTQIGLTSAMILYASGSTKNIPDTRIPCIADVLVGHNYEAVPDMTIMDSAFGAIILGITGKGSFGMYQLKNSADLPDLINGVDNWWNTDVTSQLDAAKQLFFGGSAASNLKAALGIPIAMAALGSEEVLYLGGYPCKRPDDSFITGYRIDNPIKKYSGSISIPWQSTDWKRISSFSAISMYFPFIGIIPIGATEVQGETSISYTYSLNVTSGDISLEVRVTGSGKKLATASGNIAINVPFGNTGINTNKLNTAAVTGVGVGGASIAAIVGGLTAPLAAAIGGGLASIAGNIISALGGDSSGSAGLGGGSSQGLDKVVHIAVVQKQLTDSQTNFNPIMGKPYMGVATVGSFTGFVQTDGFQFSDVQAYSSEKDMINKLLDSGIYFE